MIHDSTIQLTAGTKVNHTTQPGTRFWCGITRCPTGLTGQKDAQCLSFMSAMIPMKVFIILIQRLKGNNISFIYHVHKHFGNGYPITYGNGKFLRPRQ